MNENNFQAADPSGRLDVGDQRDGGEGRRDVRVQREHPAQDQPHRRPRRQRDGNGGNKFFSSALFDCFAQDSPHQEPRVLSKQMRSIDENRKNAKIQENFELLDADIGTGPGPVSSISGPKVTLKRVLILVAIFSIEIECEY